MSGARIDVEKLVVPIKELPTLPSVHARVLQLAADETAALGELEKVIRVDQALTAKVLRVANSAAYGFRRKFETISDAVVALGTRKLRAVASAASLSGLFKDSGLVEGQRLWAHSLAVALWTERLSVGPPPTFLFTAALMHDLGIVVLDQFARDSYHKILAVTRKGGFRLNAVESRFLGTDHAEVGAALCASWKLPEGLGETIGALYSPAPARHVLQIRLADQLADLDGFSNFVWETPGPVEDELLEALDMTRASLEGLRETAGEAIRTEVQALGDL